VEGSITERKIFIPHSGYAITGSTIASGTRSSPSSTCRMQVTRVAGVSIVFGGTPDGFPEPGIQQLVSIFETGWTMCATLSVHLNVLSELLFKLLQRGYHQRLPVQIPQPRHIINRSDFYIITLIGGSSADKLNSRFTSE
jgi:hypothetical protein